MSELLKQPIDPCATLVQGGQPVAAGYRVLVRPIDAVSQFTASGLQLMTDAQKDREVKGTQWAEVISIGEYAFRNLGGPWVAVGDVVCFRRYEGARIAIPPGSDNIYQFINDEDIWGKIPKEES